MTNAAKAIHVAASFIEAPRFCESRQTQVADEDGEEHDPRRDLFHNEQRTPVDDELVDVADSGDGVEAYEAGGEDCNAAYEHRPGVPSDWSETVRSVDREDAEYYLYEAGADFEHAEHSHVMPP